MDKQSLEKIILPVVSSRFVDKTTAVNTVKQSGFFAAASHYLDINLVDVLSKSKRKLFCKKEVLGKVLDFSVPKGCAAIEKVFAF